MRLTHAVGAALVLLAGAAVAAERPVSVMGNFFDPSAADTASLSPDGRLIALPSRGYSSDRIVLWEIASGLPLRSFGHPAFMTAHVFAPDGATVVTGHKDGVVKVWEVSSGAVLATLRMPRRSGREDGPAAVTSLWIDGKGESLVAGDGDGTVAVWRLANWKLGAVVRRPPVDKIGNVPQIVAARLSADGRRLVVLARNRLNDIDSASDHDPRTGAEIASFDWPAGHVVADDGLAGDDDVFLRVSGPECPLGELKLFGLRERAILAAVHKPAICDKPKEGREPEPAKILAGGARALIVQAGDPDLRVWDVAGRRLERVVRWPDNIGAKTVIGATRDLAAVVTREKDRLHLRALDTGLSRRELRGFVTGADNAVAAGDHLLVQREAPEGADRLDIDLRRIDGLAPISQRLEAKGDTIVYDVAPEAKRALAGNAGEIILFPLEAAGEPRKFAVPGLSEVSRARLAPDGRAMIVLGDAAEKKEAGGSVIVLLDGDGKVKQTIPGRDNDDNPTAIAFSPNGASFAVGRRDGSAEIWDTKAGRRIKKLPIYKEDGDTRTLAFSPDGRFLVGGGMFDDDVFIWNVASGKVVRVFKMGERLAGYRYATAVALSHDGRTVAAGLGQRAVSSGDIGADRGAVVVWDAGSGRRRFTLRGHKGAIFALTFSRDDKWIVSGSLDGTVRYWDRRSGRLMATAAAADAGWIVLTEGGFYAGSDGAENLVGLVRGNAAVSGNPLRARLFRPDLVEQLLKGDPDGRYRKEARRLDLAALFKAAAP